MLKILITDDHPLFRKGLQTLLASDPEFEVVGEAATAAEAVASCAELQPDVVLMDLQMRHFSPSPKAIPALTAFDSGITL